MVIRFLALGLAFALVACSNTDTTPADDASALSGTETITESDIANAPEVSGDEARIDTLRLRYAVGDVFRYRMRQEAITGPDSAKATQQSIHVYTKRIKAIRSDGSFDIGVVVDSIQMHAVVRNITTKAVLYEQHYNSADSAQRNDPQRIHLSAILGEEVTLILTPQGRIQEISGVSTIVNKIKAAVPTISDAELPALSNQIEAAVFAMLVEQEYMRFPTAALDSSRSWTSSNSTPVMDFFQATSTANYAIRSVRSVKGLRLATIDARLTGAITALPAPKGSPVTVKVTKGEVTGTGTVVIDAHKGHTVKKDNAITTNVVGVLSQPSTGLRQPVSQHTSMRYSVDLIR